VGSLPFYIATHIIRQFLEAENLPKDMVLVVQKEVGKRICGKDKMNILAIAVQFYADVKIIRYISKRAFSPQPKVDSAIIKITNIIPASHEYRKPKFNQLFFKILKAGFAHPRKQLIGNLSKTLNLTRNKTENWLLKNNIQPSQRAETLSVQNWINLTKTHNHF
jgi:16S rRNA (adenine1518-N6/adenine1519-N6)-dimethyltransferase